MLPKTPKTRVNLYDAEFDFPEKSKPEIFYAVATFARSGSNLLCEKLWATGQFGAPYEYFNYHNLMIQMILRLGVDSMQSYVEKLLELRTSPNGVFGFKVYPDQFRFMHLAHTMWRLPGLKFIYLTRKDILAQTVSYTKAMQTSQWSNYDEPQAEAAYDYKTLLINLGRIDQAMTFWESYFKNNNIQPYRVIHENMVKDPDETTSRILKDFGIEPDPEKKIELPVFEKQTYKESFNWQERFCEDMKKFNPRIHQKFALT